MSSKESYEQDVEDLGVFEWIEEPDEDAALIENPRQFLHDLRRKLDVAPPRPLLPVDYRVRWEVPGVLLWLVLTALLRNPLCWTVLALAMIGFAAWMRPALQRRYIDPITFVYGGIGVGQLMGVAADVFGIDGLRPLVIGYALLLLLLWVTLELWYLFITPDKPDVVDIYY